MRFSRGATCEFLACRFRQQYAATSHRRSSRKKTGADPNRKANPTDNDYWVRLHLIGKQVDVKKHLKELEIRAEVVVRLFRELVSRGFPGYVGYSIDDVEQRTHELYGDGPSVGFVPKEVLEEVEKTRQRSGKRRREPWDKSATPAEPPGADESDVFATARPQCFEPTRDGEIDKDENATRIAAFSDFSDLKVETGSNMIDQWKSDYLCAAMPFTLALPVGGHDIKGRKRWRRPDSAAEVTLLDQVRGLPRRVEAQFRRHWTFVPGLWNIYFRERVNLSKQLFAREKQKTTDPVCRDEENKARLAEKIYQRIEKGSYEDAQNVRRPIAGDTSKLHWAVGTSVGERRLLQNVEFITKMIPGTQAIRRRMFRIGFGASIIYGAGIFITISPTERHGHLAIKLSRYRETDPLLDPQHAAKERPWIGKDKPALDMTGGGGTEDDDWPEYEVRRLILARDPLCAVDAFTVHVRVVLACLLGIRMCPDCPHCNHGKNPCMDRFGSNAESQGGILGRCDALYGGVEVQKSGVLHFHAKAFVQRVHQYPVVKLCFAPVS